MWTYNSLWKWKTIPKSCSYKTFKSDCSVRETFHAFWTSLKSRTDWSFASLRACFSPKTSCVRSWISFPFSYNSLRASFAYKIHYKLNVREENLSKLWFLWEVECTKMHWLHFVDLESLFGRENESSNQPLALTVQELLLHNYLYIIFFCGTFFSKI